MTNFTELKNLPIYNLHDELNKMIHDQKINWNTGNQVCLNHIDRDSDDVYLGAGSLIYDWDKSYISTSSTGEQTYIVPKREKQLDSSDFKFLCNQFKNTLFEDVYNELSMKFKIGRVRLMKTNSKNCFSWHTDATARIHYPIKTQVGCFMVIDNEVMHLPQNTWWYTNTLLYHTAFNASLESRIHLVSEMLITT
jgi:hypothetical protein